MYSEKVRCFDSIGISDIEIERRRILGTVVLNMGDRTETFRLIFSYDHDISANDNIAGLILTMPLINFTYFASRLVIDFPVTENDTDMLKTFVRINNREVFINKICRRRYEFFRKEYLPLESDITPENAEGSTSVIAKRIVEESEYAMPDAGITAVLSSGGKESLLTYGMLKEIPGEVYPFFFNESGGHWLTAKVAYDHISSSDKNTLRVWSNVDRMYRFILRRMKILDEYYLDHRADTYPVRLFIFPVYIFSLIPLAIERRIGNITLGDEFDDPAEMPAFHGMQHYYGVYDQSPDFNSFMTEYFRKKGMNIRQWSAVYAITGSAVERILLGRYCELFRLQRSCHSCSSRNGNIMQCGSCTKCLGIMLFILAAGGNPEVIGFTEEAVSNITKNSEFRRIRLDSDELKTVIAKINNDQGSIVSHVEGIHVMPFENNQLESIPAEFREEIENIFSNYSEGIFSFRGKKWVMEKTLSPLS